MSKPSKVLPAGEGIIGVFCARCCKTPVPRGSYCQRCLDFDGRAVVATLLTTVERHIWSKSVSALKKLVAQMRKSGYMVPTRWLDLIDRPFKGRLKLKTDGSSIRTLSMRGL